MFWWLLCRYPAKHYSLQSTSSRGGRSCFGAARPPCQEPRGPAEVRVKPLCLRSDIISSFLRETPLCLNRARVGRDIGKEKIMIPFLKQHKREPGLRQETWGVKRLWWGLSGDGVFFFPSPALGVFWIGQSNKGVSNCPPEITDCGRWARREGFSTLDLVQSQWT